MNPLVISLNVVLFVCEFAVLVYRCINFRNLRKKTIPSYVGLSVIATSVLFTSVAAALVFLTASGDPLVCEIAVLTCIFLYTGTKAQLYIFFIERIHIVHKDPSQTRRQSKLYLLNVILLIPYVGILILMIIYRYSEIDEHKNCRIGLRDESTFPLLIYDTLFSTYSVFMFAWPLLKSKLLRQSGKLKAVAKRNVVGSVISTMSSFINIFSLYLVNDQLADSCLSFCTLDVMVNVLVMNYLISGSDKRSHDQNSSVTCNSTTTRENNISKAVSISQSETRIHPVSDTCTDECLTDDNLVSKFLDLESCTEE